MSETVVSLMQGLDLEKRIIIETRIFFESG